MSCNSTDFILKSIVFFIIRSVSVVRSLSLFSKYLEEEVMMEIPTIHCCNMVRSEQFSNDTHLQ